MAELRDEKVVFRRKDIVPLHELPSAQAHEPIVLHAVEASRTGIACRIVAATIALVLFLGAVIIGLVETGLFDNTLNARAVAALNQALGARYRVSVDHTVLRLAGFSGFALKAENVRIVEIESGKELATTESIGIVLDPLGLASGRIAVSRLDVDGAMFNAALLPKSKPLDLAALRISDVPDYLETTFERLDGVSRLIDTNGMETVKISDLGATFQGPGGKPVTLAIASLQFTRDDDGTMSIDGHFTMDGAEGEIDLTASGGAGSVRMLDGSIRNVALGKFLLGNDVNGNVHAGVDTSADVSVHAVRETDNTKPVLGLDVALAAGSVYGDGVAAELRPSTLKVGYNFDKGSIELASQDAGVGQSRFPFTGGLIDLDRVSDRPDKGFAIDLVFSNAVSRPVDSSEAPIHFDAKVNGYYLPKTKNLLFEEMAVSSEKGNVAGSLAMRFGDREPEVSFVMIASELESAAVKQFWPFWMAKTARSWVIKNIFGGTVTNGRIEFYLAEGRERLPGVPMHLGPEELKIDFDIEGARMNVAGEIPPLRDTSGKFRLRGPRTEITINGGTAYFPSGRSVGLTGGTFVLPDNYTKPLMADMDIDVAGNADAIAELVTYRPIRALPATGFAPDDFSGQVKAKVKAHFGVISAHNPPPPQWTAALTLDNVDVAKPIAGRAVTGLRGLLAIDPQKADLKAKGDIDGVTLDIELVEPVGKAASFKRKTVLSGTLDNRDRRKLLPGLDDVVEGPVGVRLEQDGDGPMAAEADVGAAAVSIPWIGWTKGAGIGGKITLTADKKEGVTRVSDFRFAGDGFSVAGNLTFRGARLDAANFSTVRLSADDRFRVKVERGKSGYTIVADGEAADVRAVLARLKNPTGGGGEKQSVTIRADLARAVGFNGETLSNVSFRYSTAGSRISGVDLSAVTKSGAPVVAQLASSGASDAIQLTSGDAGAVARFADIYGHMRGGLLNVRLRETAGSIWRGSVDVRNFALVGEERLRSLVSTPAGESGRSLNDAVRREIDVSAVKFSRGFAQVRTGGGALSLENGVVRGETVGATFQGTVRDANGRTDMTGTFMPAYGLNRLFAELPLIGIILGNGNDRGLIGITFKLSGPFDKPKLTINPLSIIAPGVFRNIFEFQ
ncbi:membrane protein [Shinella sp. SUS2]|uniref:YhdP family protein n=1 Tax=Shinella sp. SUS2 TaxID=1692241 RepID=UPI000682B14E|nr:AsmA-like C-terminal region-containing protein [Shinella sp. SUS2]KNY16893.1 membrane protein [Shinella sp. SUS2]